MVGTRLNRDIFQALAAIAWADGSLEQEEADAIVRAAVDAGLTPAEIGVVTTMTAAPVDLGVIDRSSLSRDDRLFVYSVASWIAFVDGKLTEGEGAVLAKLGERLGVPERARAQAEAVVRELGGLGEGARPGRYDLGKLRNLLDERFSRMRGGRTS